MSLETGGGAPLHLGAGRSRVSRLWKLVRRTFDLAELERFRAPVLLVAVGEMHETPFGLRRGKPKDEAGRGRSVFKQIRPLPLYGLRYHHRGVALSTFTVLWLDLFLHMPPIASDLGWFAAPLQVSAIAGLSGAAAILFYAGVAAPPTLLRAAALGHMTLHRRPRADRALASLRRWAMKYASASVLGCYGLAFAAVWAAGTVAGTEHNPLGWAVMGAAFLVCLVGPPSLFFAQRSLVVHDSRDLTSLRGELAEPALPLARERRRMEELGPLLHGYETRAWRYHFRLLRHVLAPYRRMHPALATEQATDPAQMAIAKIYVTRRILRGGDLQFAAVIYALVGGWLLLTAAAFLRLALPAALVLGAIVMSVVAIAYLARLHGQLEEVLVLTEREMEAQPSWLFPRRPSEDGPVALRRQIRINYWPRLSKALGAVAGVALVSFVAALETAELLNPHGVLPLRTEASCRFSPLALHGTSPGQNDDAGRACSDILLKLGPPPQPHAPSSLPPVLPAAETDA